MKKRLFIMILALIVVFGGLIGFNLFKSYMIKRFFAAYEPPAVTVSSVQAQSVNWHSQLDAVGNFVALNGVDVNSQIAGNVVKLHFDSGQYIEKGQPLIVIDDSTQQAMLKFNQAELVLKELSYKRQTDLFKRGATASSNVDEAKAELDKAQAKVEEIQAEIHQKHITAPFTGRLGIRQVDLGQYVKPGDTSIVTLQSIDPLHIDFYLPEQLFMKLHLDQNISFRVVEFPNMLFKGQISAINSKVDPSTHNILVRATIPNCPAKAMQDIKNTNLIKTNPQPGGSDTVIHCDTATNITNKINQFIFIPGMFAAIEVEQPAQADTIILPSTAISYSLYGDSVYVIEKDPKGRKDSNNKDILTVKRRFITIGEQRGNYTVITKGIKAGEEVVSAGEMKLQNGTRIVINNDIQLEDADLQSLGE